MRLRHSDSTPTALRQFCLSDSIDDYDNNPIGVVVVVVVRPAELG